MIYREAVERNFHNSARKYEADMRSVQRAAMLKKKGKLVKIKHVYTGIKLLGYCICSFESCLFFAADEHYLLRKLSNFWTKQHNLGRWNEAVDEVDMEGSMSLFKEIRKKKINKYASRKANHTIRLRRHDHVEEIKVVSCFRSRDSC